jgi:hypothetical protein
MLFAGLCMLGSVRDDDEVRAIHITTHRCQAVPSSWWSLEGRVVPLAASQAPPLDGALNLAILVACPKTKHTI